MLMGSRIEAVIIFHIGNSSVWRRSKNSSPECRDNLLRCQHINRRARHCFFDALRHLRPRRPSPVRRRTLANIPIPWGCRQRRKPSSLRPACAASRCRRASFLVSSCGWLNHPAQSLPRSRRTNASYSASSRPIPRVSHLLPALIADFNHFGYTPRPLHSSQEAELL